MIDPRTSTPYEPRQELKDKLAGYDFTKEGTFLKIDLGETSTIISEKRVMKMTAEQLKQHLDFAKNQDEIKSRLTPPTADREADME